VIVDAELVKRLLDLNRDFYSRFARDFSETRGVERMNIEPLAPYLKSGAKVLDVGCGNGRLVKRLDRAGYALDYVGVDASTELIEIAHTRQFQNVAVELRVADITLPGWTQTLPAPFDLTLAFAVLHHVPSFELRRRVLRDIHVLLKPGGVLVLSNWQFTRGDRLRKKLVPWQRLSIDERELEEGDALLDWQRGGTGYRYVHLLTETEVQSLAEQSDFEVIEQFYADADLNLWSALRA
jgi:tRNA (uracil-5-)-methyltransferase TRM9